ncbi:uncharacterized protein EV420DRAFT_1518295 [Desarmillaria tabescens]|uniref:Uncharacterized protein n=1 Tax=Armillaria tabescens TaxID=1929756 RepID=A0AA39ND49_ARMTA|nr:uncharacterized protein EV420DRAFT_1518295 [Desarmillaria tabescens]KAK0463450.1 hypothetical protein EV420DRAFT_1518295 [Desarmillaria tabescens]
MCHRRISSTRFLCGHDAPHGDQRIDCGSSKCRYSSHHYAINHECRKSCRQWLRPSHNVVTKKVDTLCYHCKLAGGPQHH